MVLDSAQADESVSSLLRDLDQPGVFPARQARSRAAAAALMAAALDLLRDRGFEALSVAEVAARAGLTVGAFYARFEGKEAFLRALQAAVVAEAAGRMRARLTPGRFAGTSLRGFLGGTAAGSVRWSRRHEGLIRASLRTTEADPAAWSPLRDLGRLQVALSLPIILGVLGRPDGPAPLVEAIRFAHQMLFGTLNTMILVNPGPFTIHDAATPRMLAEAMAVTIEGAAGV